MNRVYTPLCFLSSIIFLKFFAKNPQDKVLITIKVFKFPKELRNYLELENGVPSDDTIRIVSSKLMTLVKF